jgi:hypothetical protein
MQVSNELFLQKLPSKLTPAVLAILEAEIGRIEV